jgi:hypothetical protein
MKRPIFLILFLVLLIASFFASAKTINITVLNRPTGFPDIQIVY